MVAIPSIRTLIDRTIWVLYLSTIHPAGTDATDAARPPTLAAPAITVLLHPRSEFIDAMNTPIIRLAAAFLTMAEVPTEASTIHP